MKLQFKIKAKISWMIKLKI